MSSIFLIIIIAFVILLFAFYYLPFGLYFVAKLTGLDISFVYITGLQFKKIPPKIIVRGLIIAHKAELKDITKEKLEKHFKEGGDVDNVITALALAKSNNIPLKTEDAFKSNLKGIDVLEVIKKAVEIKNNEKSDN